MLGRFGLERGRAYTAEQMATYTFRLLRVVLEDVPARK
jgi:hypothetical protein